MGARSQGFDESRLSDGVFAAISSSEPIRSPCAVFTTRAGSSVAASPLTVEQVAEMSNRPSSLTATTDGPMPGRQTRPTSVPR